MYVHNLTSRFEAVTYEHLLAGNIFLQETKIILLKIIIQEFWNCNFLNNLSTPKTTSITLLVLTLTSLINTFIAQSSSILMHSLNAFDFHSISFLGWKNWLLWLYRSDFTLSNYNETFVVVITYIYFYNYRIIFISNTF